MTHYAPPTTAQVLDALTPPALPGPAPTAAWPAPHRVLVTAAGALLCLLAGVGCADTRASVAQRAVAPTYSYVHDASPEAHRALWPLAPIGSATLMADATPTP